MYLDVILHAVDGVLTLLLIGMVGYALAGRGWFGVETQRLLPRLTMEITLPPYMFYVQATAISRNELLDMVYAGLLPFTAMTLTYLFSRLLIRLLRIPKGKRGITSVAFTCSNTIYLGLPINLALFGEAALPYVLLYYAVNSMLFWTMGVYLVAGDSEDSKHALLSRETLRSFISPPMMGLISGVMAVLLHIPLPPFLLNSSKMLGGITIPLILLSLGITMHGMRLRNIRPNRELILILLGRFICSPLILFGLSFFFPVPTLMLQVFIIQSSLPVITNLAVVANYYKANEELGALAVTSSTLLCLFTVPLLMILVTLAL